MTELPFQQPPTLNIRQNRALALAAVFQATQLTHMTALTGHKVLVKAVTFILNSLIKASLNIRPSSNQQCPDSRFF